MRGIYASTNPLSILFIHSIISRSVFVVGISASNLTRDPVPSGAQCWLGEVVEVIVGVGAAASLSLPESVGGLSCCPVSQVDWFWSSVVLPTWVPVRPAVIVVEHTSPRCALLW